MATAGKQPSAKRKWILVVDDDLDLGETMREALESEGYAVSTATNGNEGLKCLKSSVQPSLILLDMMMPVLNGRAFLDLVLANPALASTPVVIISGTATDKEALGAKAVLRKPFVMAKLFAAVAKYAV